MKIIKFIFIINLLFFYIQDVYANSFGQWKIKFKTYALNQGISLNTINELIGNSRYLPDVIKYDRFQPEFYEDTKTYVSKRTSKKRVLLGKKLYNNNQKIINKISKEYNVDKYLLLSLMGIETNFGKYLGKMDIVSSLATLSYDKRRSEFFTSELITLLRLVDEKKINPNTLFGSWAGAFGNFQFMPSTINNYALDYNNDGVIDLKNIEDSFASAANYLNNLGWNNNIPCFYNIELENSIPLEFLNTSAKKIKKKENLNFFLKFINNNNISNSYNNISAAIVTPDAEIVDNADKFSPAFIVFNNYELILKWNRSLRFGLAVCTLRDKFKNEL